MSQFHNTEVSDKAKKFLDELDLRLKEKDVQKIHELREGRFTELQAADEVPKPEAAQKKLDVSEESLTMLLYKELHTRHIYSNAKKPEDIKIEDKVEAWKNYLDLFDKVLDGSERGAVDFDLPNGWLYDIVDEFVYQLQVYCRYRAERRGAKAKDQADEAEKLREIQKHPTIWEPVTVIRYLQRLVVRSDIIQVLGHIKVGKATAADVLSPGPMHVQRVWGYFAMVGLLRVHTLMGDYYQALRAVEHIDFTPEKEGEKIFKKVQACHITILYYAGFAYMMMRRHYDSVRILLQALRSRSLESNSPNQTMSNIAKMRDNCAKLLAMALELAGRNPQMLGDETFAGLLAQRTKNEDRELLKQGTEDSVQTYKSLFMQACPRFFLPSAALDSVEYSDAGKNEALNQQLNPFLREVKQQLRLPILRGYLKLYSTITLEKLGRTSRDTARDTPADEAEVQETPEVDEAEERAVLTRELLCLKHKSRQVAWGGGGSPLAGSLKCLADVDLYFDMDVVHIDADFRRPQAGAAYFVRHIETLRTAAKGLNPSDIFKKRMLN